MYFYFPEIQSTKQEISVLEAENADSENLRVTAELKVVDLEEQMDSLYKFYKNKHQSEIEENKTEKEISEDDNKVSSSEVSVDKLHEKIEILMEKNRELKIELKELKKRSLNVDKKSSETDSTESFERMSDENNEIIRKISVMEEQGTELSENMSQSSHQKIENLVQENNDLVIELTKLQEKFDSTLKEKNNFKSQIDELNEKLSSVNILSSQNSDIIIKLTNMELENIQLKDNLQKLLNKDVLASLESEILHCKQINENQMELVKNIKQELENSEKEVVEKQEEIDVCQNIIKNSTIIESNYLKMEKIIKNLKQEKLTIVEKMNQSENENLKLTSQLKVTEEDTKSSIQIFSDKIIELETKLIEKDSIIESQQSEMELLKESIEKHKKSIEELSGEIVEFKQLIDQLENEKIRIKEENEVLKSQVTFKDDSITALEEEFKTTVKVINDQLRDKEVMMMSFDNQIPLLQESLEEKNQNILDLQDEIKTLEGLSGDNEKIFVNYQNEIAELQEALNEKEKILSVLQESLDEKEKVNNNFGEILKEKENITINLREELSEKEELITNLKLEVSCAVASLHDHIQQNLKSENEEMNMEKNKYEEKIMAIEKQLQEAKEAADAQEDSIRELKSMIDKKEDIISNLNENETMLTEKIVQIEAMVNDKHSQLEANVQLIDRLNGEIDNYEVTIKDNELKILKLHEEVLNLDNSISEYKNQIALLEDDIVSLNDKVRSKENYENKNEEMLREIGENEEIIRDLKMKIDEKLTDNQELRTEIETINNELNKYQGILFEKENFISSLVAEKENFEVILSDKSSHLEQQISYNNQLQTELNDAYRMMEQLKLKHTEDIQMMNDRTQDLIEELQLKSKELSDLQITLEEKEKIISQNMAEEVRKSFEDKIILLENQLQDTTNNMQNQLQKMKIIAANLKKKTTQCQQLETKLGDYEEKWTVEKSEKEEMNLKIQELETIVETKSIEIEKLEQVNTEFKHSADIAKENIEKLGNELDLTRDKIESLMQESATLMTEIAKKHQEIEVKNSEIQSLHLHKDALTSEYEEFKTMATAAKTLAEEKVKELESSLDSAHGEIKSLNEQIASLKMVHEEINLHMEHMTTEIETKSTDLAQRGLIINQQASETQQKSHDIEQKSLEIQEKSLEIEQKLLEIHDKSLEIKRKLFEIEEKKIEIEQKSSEIEKQTIEIQRKSLEMEEKDNELANKLSEIEALNEEFASYRERNTIEKQQMEISYEDTTEKARELGVRMQVMENEYLEQLSIIQKLKTDNGMLMSKQTQINERLENAEVELLERDKTIETLQSNIAQLNNPENQVTQRLVSMLESKLHERNAEIENLDNELATAISNFLQMRESLRSGEMATADHQQKEIGNSVVEFNDLLERNAELERKICEMDEKLMILTTKNSEYEENILQKNETAGEAENIGILYSELLEINQAHKIELEKVKNINQELEFEKEELLRKLEILKVEKEHRISKKEKENITEPQLFDASKLFTSTSPWDSQNDKEVESLKNHLEERQAMCNKLTEDIAALSQEIQSYKHEIQEINAINEKITNEKIELLNVQEKQQILCSNYEENMKILSENLQSLEVKQSDYLRVISQFIIELKNKTQEESLEMPLELNLPILSSKLNLILAIIDKLKSSKSQLTIQGEEIAEEELKCEESVQLSSSQATCNEEIKLDDDEEVWGWNPQEAELSTAVPLAPICSSETQLKAKIAELEDTIKDLGDEKIKLNDDIKTSQIRSGKLVKKLKEFKIQNGGLQKQLKLQISSGSLNDLDSAIQEELKCQVEKLEKSLIELKNENNKITLERDQLTKRIDILMAGHERFTELKERQDRDMEVLQIRNNELMTKLSNIEREYSEKSITEIKEIEKLPDTITEKASEEISIEKFNELQESLELLATENEELRLLIEDEKVSRVAIEVKLSNKLREIEVQRQSIEEKLEGKIKESEEDRAQRLATIEKLNEQVRETENERSQRFVLENKLTETMKEIEISKRHVDEMRMNHDEAIKNQQSIGLEQSYSEKIQQLESEIIEKTSRIGFLEGDLESSQLHLREISESLENVTELLNARVQEVADLRTQIQKLEFDKNSMEFDRQNVEEMHEKDKATGQKLAEKDDEILELSSKFTSELNEKIDEISALSSKIEELHLEREGMITKIDNQAQEIVFFREKLDEKEWLLEKFNSEKSINEQKISSYEEEINNSSVLINQLQNFVTTLEQSMSEKSQELSEKEEEIIKLNKMISELQSSLVSVPICEENIEDKSRIIELKTQLDNKLEEIEDWKYILDKNTYPKILQELQDKINLLYNEKLELETALSSTQQQLQSLLQDQSFPNIQQSPAVLQSLENIEEIEKILKFKDEEINLLIRKLESKTIECSLLENALAKQLPGYSEKDDGTLGESSQNVPNVREPKSNELDIALYMLHQRDVRCEELTHELMQLLEERDTLQLRLSNAIRLNEEIRRILPAEAERSITEKWPAADPSSSSTSSPEDKVDLAQK